jgi:hypothetical protein
MERNAYCQRAEHFGLATAYGLLNSVYQRAIRAIEDPRTTDFAEDPWQRLQLFQFCAFFERMKGVELGQRSLFLQGVARNYLSMSENSAFVHMLFGFVAGGFAPKEPENAVQRDLVADMRKKLSQPWILIRKKGEDLISNPKDFLNKNVTKHLQWENEMVQSLEQCVRRMGLQAGEPEAARDMLEELSIFMFYALVDLIPLGGAAYHLQPVERGHELAHRTLARVYASWLKNVRPRGSDCTERGRA